MQTFGLVILLIYSIFPVLLVWGVDRERKKQCKYNGKNPVFVSVVVAVRNQADRIESFLLDLVSQTFPCARFQVILVDDHSTDETLTRARRVARRFPESLHVVSSPDTAWKSSKKAALAAGIRAAKGEWILLTDSDTFPPPTWLEGMSKYMAPHTVLISGFSPQMAKQDGCWSDFLQVDSLASALVAAGTIGWGSGVTCSGRNLAYRYQDFVAVQGFASTPDTLSGDDDFILQRLTSFKGGGLVYALDPKTHVPAAGPANATAFLQQKQRHLSAGKSYNSCAQVGYVVFHLCNLLLYALATGICGDLPFYLALLGTKIAFDAVILKMFCRFLDISFKIRGWLIWEILFPASHLLAAPIAFFGRPRWNTR